MTEDRRSDAAKYPHDFALFSLGTFDDNTGDIGSEGGLRNLGLVSLIQQEYADVVKKQRIRDLENAIGDDASVRGEPEGGDSA